MLKVGKDSHDICAITWVVSNVCNFSCAYCPDELHNHTNKFPSSYESVLKFIKKATNLNKMVHIELTGGEPTLWPKLIGFLQEMRCLPNVTVEITTNGSRSEKFWKNFCEMDFHENTFLIFTYHSAFCDPDTFYRNLDIAGNRHTVYVCFMLDPKHFQKTQKLFQKVSDNLPVDCNFQIARDKFHNSRFIEGYTEEMLQLGRTPSKKYNRKKFPKKKELRWPLNVYIDNQSVQWRNMVINKNHCFKGWKCSAGRKRFFIYFTGDVYSCSQFVGQDDRPFHLGNILYEEDIKILNEHITCPEDYCPCLSDAAVPKYSSEYKGSL